MGNIALIKRASYIAAIAVGVYGLKVYMNGAVCTSQDRLDDKVVVITGANTGIGKETAKDLVQRGAKVYLACRSLERAKEAVADIQKETGASADQLPIILLDLASLKSVREFVKIFKTKETKLDILINNAGVLSSSGRKTEDGFELTLGVNHLGHFLLTHLLVDILLSAPRGRIINVSAKLYDHGLGKINFDDIMFNKNFNWIEPYCQSKLANLLFTRELAKRLKGTGVTVYSLHPGVVTTEILRDVPFFNNAFIKPLISLVFRLILKDARGGAQTTIYCAVDQELANESGKYYSDCKEKALKPIALDDVAAKKLWDLSVEFVKLVPSEIHPSLK